MENSWTINNEHNRRKVKQSELRGYPTGLGGPSDNSVSSSVINWLSYCHDFSGDKNASELIKNNKRACGL